ncbi:MAG: LytTR family DNA-binding domain-containing protein [Pseudomonadota bacterium]
MIALAAVVMVLMQLSDQEGSGSLWVDAALFVGRALAVVACFAAAEWLVERVEPHRLAQPHWLRPVVLGGLLACVPLAGLELYLEQQVPQAAAYDESDLLDSSVPLAFLAEYGTVASILLPTNFLLWQWLSRRQATGAANEPETVVGTEGAAEFLAKIPGIAIGDVVALEAQEHYVRVHHSKGSDLIYHRFSDAVTSIGVEHGVRVHRSWWVADSAIERATRKGRQHRLLLRNQLEVPVSHSNLEAVRSRGLLRR